MIAAAFGELAPMSGPSRPRPTLPNPLSETERAQVMAVLLEPGGHLGVGQAAGCGHVSVLDRHDVSNPA